MRRSGFTLIEMLIASTLLTVAMGAIWQTWMNAQESSALIEGKLTADDSATSALTKIQRALRGASRASLSPLPGDSISFRSVADADGNGLGIDAHGSMELGGPITIRRDLEDANGDGIRASQLLLIHGAEMQVLASNLSSGDAAEAGAATAGGVWFEARGEAVLVRVRTMERTRRGFAAPILAEQLIYPRNP